MAHCTKESKAVATGVGGTLNGTLNLNLSSLNKIGSGGFSTVYSATYKGSNCAAKVIPVTARCTWEDILNELLLINSCQNENVIELFGYCEVFDVKGRRNMIMILELAKYDLFELVKTRGFLPEKEALELFKQVVSAVYHLHKQKIVHRDIKLENVLITDDGACKLADFGLAHRTEKEQVLNKKCGSLSYSAPEILSDMGYSGYRADEWSLGICLFCMVYGFFPFVSTHVTDTMYEQIQVQTQTGDSFAHAVCVLQEKTCHTSPLITQLIDKLLKHSPSKRISTYDAFSLLSA